jgi:predicted phosphate transport protein (TIGR00153 family)
MKGLLGNFLLAGRKERLVLGLISDHFDVVIQTVNALQPALGSAKTGNWGEVEEKTARVDELETLADGLHRDAVVAISQGAFFSGMRDDFLELMEEDDEMADAAKDAARILAELPLQPASFLLLYENPKATLAQLFTKIQSTMMLLQESISALESDAELAVSKSLLVERAEEEADEIKNQLLRSIFSHRSGLEVLTLLQLRDFVLNLDEIADAAEDASDLVISIVAKAEA